MRNRSIYAKLFPKMKDVPGPFGNTGRPEPDAMSMGPGPEDVQPAAAPVEAAAHVDMGVPKPPSSKPYDPAEDYYDNGIKRGVMDERAPDGSPIGGEAGWLEQTGMNPNYNPKYDQTQGGAATPSSSVGDDTDEEKRLAEVAAAASGEKPRFWEQPLDQKEEGYSRSAPIIDRSGRGADRPATLTPAEKKAQREKQAVDTRSMMNEDYIPADGPKTAAPSVDYAKKEAELEQQSRMALLRPDDMRPGTAKQQKRVEEDAAYEEKKKASLTYENPKTAAEKAQNRKDELRFMRDNPRNEDHGVKGFIRETLQNFFHGLSMAQGVPGISIPQALMLGGTGAGLGMVNRKWNEQRMAEQKLPGAMQDVAFESDQETKASTNRAREATARTQGINAQTAQIKAMTDAGATTLIEDADGRLWNRDKSGKNTTPFKDPITGQQMTKKNVAVTLPDGRVVYTSGDKAIDRQIAEDYRNAQNAFEAKKLNQADLDDYQKRLDAWSTANVDHEIKRRAILTDGEALVQAADAQMAQAEAMDDPVEKTKALSEAASKKAQGVAKIKQANEWKTLPKPTPPSANLKAPSAGSNIAGKLYPSPAALRPAFPNKTDDEIRKIITGQGGKFVN